ncbi:MAG: DMT family transporter [Muribaculaceae bacterium]|nr:DMT family transporter [Muribaculaceae bacterium]
MNALSLVRKKRAGRGYLLAAIASCTYGLNPLFAVPLYDIGLNVNSVLFYRYTAAAVVLAIVMLLSKMSFRLHRREVVPLVFAGILFAVSSLFLFYSYKFMDVGIASTILYVTPFFVAAIMAVFFHQRIPIVGIVCIAVAMIGIGMLSIKADSTIQNPVGIVCVIGSSLTYAIYMIIINRTCLNGMGIVPLTFYSIVVGVAVFAVFMDFFRDLAPLPMTYTAIYNVAGLAIFPTVVSILTMTVAIQDIGPVPTSILEALEPVTALMIGCLIFGESLTALNMAGVAVVLSAVTLFVLSKHS